MGDVCTKKHQWKKLNRTSNGIYHGQRRKKEIEVAGDAQGTKATVVVQKLYKTRILLERLARSQIAIFTNVTLVESTSSLSVKP